MVTPISIGVLICCLIAATAQIIWNMGVQEKLQRDKNFLELKYAQLKERHEFCMDQVLSKAASVAITVNKIRRVRDSGRRPKWTVHDMQCLSSEAFNLMKLVEDNVVHSDVD